MIVLADTHALIWWLTAPSRLSEQALQQLHRAYEDPAGGILVSVASRIDLHYLAAKGKLDAELLRSVWDVVEAPDVNTRPVPITARIAERFGTAQFADALPDPWDRLIVATALELDVLLVTKDRAMHGLADQLPVQVVW